MISEEESERIKEMLNSSNQEDVELGFSMLDELPFIENISRIMIVLSECPYTANRFFKSVPKIHLKLRGIYPNQIITDDFFKIKFLVRIIQVVEISLENQQILLDYLAKCIRNDLKRYGYDMEEISINIRKPYNINE